MTLLRARMIADMTARTLGPASQTSPLRACKRFAAWLGRSPKTATPDARITARLPALSGSATRVTLDDVVGLHPLASPDRLGSSFRTPPRPPAPGGCRSVLASEPPPLPGRPFRTSPRTPLRSSPDGVKKDTLSTLSHRHNGATPPQGSRASPFRRARAL